MELTANKYKVTEVGLLPEDWKVSSLEELFKIIGGGTFKSKDRVTNGVKWLKIANVGVKKVKWDEIDYLPTQFLQLYSDFVLNEGDIIMALTRPILGRELKIARVMKKDEPCLLNQRVGKIEPITNFDSDWIYHLLQSYKSIIGLLDSMAGSDPPNLSNKGIYSVRLPIPPNISEQKAIAKVLTDTDALIQALEKKIAKKKLIKKGVMQKLLTPKDGWVTKKLNEIGVVTGAGVDKKINEKENKVKLLNYMDVFKKDYLFQDMFNHEVTAPLSKISSCNVLKGDVFLTPSSEMRTDIGISGLAMEDMEGIVYSYHINRLRYNIDIDFKFGLYILKTRNFLEQVETLCEGSGKRYVLSLTKFKELEITFPENKKEQQGISEILYSIDLEIEKLEQKLSKYQLAKQGMMQQLLTGKIRIV